MITTVSRRLLETAAKNNVVREEDPFQVDLRFRGVSQDAIYKDEERMTKIQTSS